MEPQQATFGLRLAVCFPTVAGHASICTTACLVYTCRRILHPARLCYRHFVCFLHCRMLAPSMHATKLPSSIVTNHRAIICNSASVINYGHVYIFICTRANKIIVISSTNLPGAVAEQGCRGCSSPPTTLASMEAPPYNFCGERRRKEKILRRNKKE